MHVHACVQALVGGRDVGDGVIVMTYIVMVYIVMGYIVLAYMVMAYVVMAYIVMAKPWLMDAASETE